MKNLTRITACIIAASTLSGCQSFMGAFNFGDAKVQRADAGEGPVFGAEELERGRAALKAGYAANAIDQFRLATLNEKTAPDAFNGMAVAYARLGRADLAENYFKTALSLDSANPKFAANLQNFYQSPLGNTSRALAMRQAEADRQLAAAAQEASAQGLIADSDAAPRNAAARPIREVVLNRQGNARREIMITTRAPSAEPMGAMPTVASRTPAAPKLVAKAEEAAPQPAASEVADAAPAAAAPNAKKSKQISLLGASGDSASYPVRISLVKPNATSRSAVTTGQRGYPLRVAMGQTAPGQ